jgi:hypothetical protein
MMAGPKALPIGQESPDLTVISADLLAKRRELSAELDRAQAVITRIQSEIGAVDTVLRLFGAGSPLHQAVLPLYRRDTSKIVLLALRASPHPLTSPELARIVLTERKMSLHDEKLVKAVGARVRGSLSHFRRRGVLTATENADGLLAWRYADMPAAAGVASGETCSR